MIRKDSSAANCRIAGLASARSSACFWAALRFTAAIKRSFSSSALAAEVSALSSALKAATFFCLVTLLFARPATAADLALLRNGFTVRHQHRQVIAATTRLYLGTDDSTFTDVPTADITGYEKDLSLFASPDSAASVPTPFEAARSAPSKPAHPANLNEVVNDASATYHLDPALVNCLRHLLERYNFDIVKALAAYNAGPQRVEQYRGWPPYRRARAYVAPIVHYD